MLLSNKVLPAVLLVISLLGCQSRVAVKNARVYGDLGPYGAHWAETLTKNTGDVDKPTWDQMRFGMLCLSSTDWVATETTQQELCQEFQVCDYQTAAKILEVQKKIHDVAMHAMSVRRRYQREHPGMTLAEPQ